MRLSDEQVRTYDSSGFLLVEDLFTPEELRSVLDVVDRAGREPGEGRVLETDGSTVRALHGLHRTEPFFERLVRNPRLLEPARQILGGDVYVHQFKVNLKAPFRGDVWPWHQDFVFWLHEDGIPSPGLLNFALFLDDVTEFNGPLYFVPGSHVEGVLAPEQIASDAESEPWTAGFVARLKYTLGPDAVRALVDAHGMVAPRGRAGTALLFHPNLVHGSPPNISPYPRRILLVTYNQVANRPRVTPTRPEFIVSRDYTALVTLDEDRLLR